MKPEEMPDRPKTKKLLAEVTGGQIKLATEGFDDLIELAVLIQVIQGMIMEKIQKDMMLRQNILLNSKIDNNGRIIQ